MILKAISTYFQFHKYIFQMLIKSIIFLYIFALSSRWHWWNEVRKSRNQIKWFDTRRRRRRRWSRKKIIPNANRYFELREDVCNSYVCLPYKFLKKSCHFNHFKISIPLSMGQNHVFVFLYSPRNSRNCGVPKDTRCWSIL